MVHVVLASRTVAVEKLRVIEKLWVAVFCDIDYHTIEH